MTAAELLTGDPLGELIRARFRLSPRGYGLMAFVLAAVYSLLLPAVFGVLAARPGVLSALQDASGLGILLLVGPAIWYYYAWQIGALELVYRELVRCAEDSPQMAAAVERNRPRLSKTWAAPFAALAATALSVAYVLQTRSQAGSTWLNYNWVMIAALQIIRWPTFYMLTMVLIRQLHTAAAINRLLANARLKVVPMHPDGAGGLSGLGRYAVASAYVSAIAGLYLGLVVLRRGLPALAPGDLVFPGVLAYLGLALLLFLWPLFNVHRQMAAAKWRLLTDIAALFEDEYGRLMGHLRRDVLPSNATIRLRAYRKMYRIGESVPEWPLSLGFISRLVVSIVLPVMVPLSLNLLAIQLLRRFPP